MKAKVLWWRFPDNLSAANVMRVYVNDDLRAIEDLALVQLDESRKWELTEVPAFIKEQEEP